MISEDVRYRLYRFGAHFAWWSATAWTAILTWVNLTRPVTALPSTFQRVSGLFILLLMGIAIALGSALSRMRLARTITQVFQVGVEVAAAGAEGRQREIMNLLHHCVRITDLDGKESKLDGKEPKKGETIP